MIPPYAPDAPHRGTSLQAPRARLNGNVPEHTRAVNEEPGRERRAAERRSVCVCVSGVSVRAFVRACEREKDSVCVRVYVTKNKR